MTNQIRIIQSRGVIALPSSPTPWSSEENAGKSIADSNGNFIFHDSDNLTIKERELNARYLVIAANNHEELIDLCRKSLQYLKESGIDKPHFLAQLEGAIDRITA